MRTQRFLFVMLALVACAGTHAGQARTPVKPFAHWREVKPGPPLPFAPPPVERVELPNGMVLFLLPDHELPLVECSILLRFGGVFEPDDKLGLAEICAETMRSGGSASMPGDELDAYLEDRAATLRIGLGQDSGSASLSCLKEDFDDLLMVFVEVLRKPAFPEEKLELALTRARTGIAKRNDNPSAILRREFDKVLYEKKGGKPSPYARHPEYATLNAIDGEALRAFHAAHFRPNRFILGISGDFDAPAMLEKLKTAFGNWLSGEGKPPEPPKAEVRSQAGVYLVDRPHLNQTAFAMGHGIDVRRDAADYPAIRVMNEVLSGGLAGRFFTEVRTRKGLAYSVRGYARVQYEREGDFSCYCMTRNEQALDAVAAVRGEVERLKTGGVTPEELAAAKESLLNAYVFNYDDPGKILDAMQTCEQHGYPLDFDRTLFAALQKVSAEDVNRVAAKYLAPEKFTLMMVGNRAAYGAGLEALGKVEPVDVAIPAPAPVPMVIDPEREKRGKALLEAALKAAGGVEALSKVKTLRADLQLQHGMLKLRATMQARVPDLVRVDVAGPFGPLTQIMGGAEAWQASGSWVKPIEPKEALENMRALTQTDLGILLVLAQGREGFNVQALDPVREEGRVLEGVMLEAAPFGRVRLYFDEASHRLVKMRYLPEGGSRMAEKTFSEHRAYGALTLARRIEDGNPKARVRMVELDAVELNPELGGALFAKPERAMAPIPPLKP